MVKILGNNVRTERRCSPYHFRAGFFRRASRGSLLGPNTDRCGQSRRQKHHGGAASYKTMPRTRSAFKCVFTHINLPTWGILERNTSRIAASEVSRAFERISRFAQ